MMKPPSPPDEVARLRVLTALRLLDTSPEERFDRITRLARRVFDVPIALVSLVDAERQWFKSRAGLEARETPRDVSFCGHAILRAEPLVVNDARADARFCDNPLVLGDPNIRFYAGWPLEVPPCHRIGTLCIIDRQPRILSEADVSVLGDLARLVQDELVALELASVDELTGLANRRGFRVVAEKCLAICRRMGQPAVLGYIDLDDFKSINDTYGHDAGDRALVSMACILERTLRESDVIARLGGDEFAVLFTGMQAEGAAPAVRRLEAAVADHNARANEPWKIHFSLGLARYESAQHPSLDALMAAADQRMYEVKQRR